MRKNNPPLFLALSLLALALFFFGAGRVSALRSVDVKTVSVSVAQGFITPTPSDIQTPLPTGGPPLSLTLTLLFTCCALGLVIGVLVIGFIIAMQKQKEEKKEQTS